MAAPTCNAVVPVHIRCAMCPGVVIMGALGFGSLAVMTEIDVRTNQPAVDGQPQRARPRGAATVAKGGRGRRTAGGAPAQFGMDPVLWAAWLYYQEGLTQEEVARRIGVGRTTALGYLSEARDRGLIRVVVRPDALSTIETAGRLREVYGLADALVVPDDRGRRPPLMRVGEAGATYLQEVIRPGDILGVAWGRTVLALSNALAETTVSGLSVVPVLGGMAAEDGFSAEDCTSNIARRLGGRAIHLHVPASLSSPELKQALLAEPSVQRGLAALHQCSKLVSGICTVETSSLVFHSGLIGARESAAYRAGGAVGVIAGRFYDAAGRPVVGDLDNRLIGLTLEEIRRIPQRIAVAGGPEKIASIRAALHGDLVTCLVTDQKTAEALLDGT